MINQVGGYPALVESALPGAVNIVSTSAAGVIIVTVAAVPAGWAVGDAVAVAGATDSAANGQWQTGALTGTTITLTSYPAGSASVAAGGGAAVGTISNLGFGVTFQIPADITDPRAAQSVNVALEALGDRTAWLARWTQVQAQAKFVLKAGDTMTGALTVQSTITATGLVVAQAGVTVSQSQNLTAGGTGAQLAGTWTDNGPLIIGSTGYLALTGRLIRRATANLSHSGTIHTATFVDVGVANDHVYLGAATAPNNNYLKIREGTSVAAGGLQSGDWIRFTMGPNAPAGQLYTVFREDGTTALAELWGAGQWLELAWDGSKWRYVTSSPWVPTGTAIPGNAAYYGDGNLGTSGVVLYPANL